MTIDTFSINASSKTLTFNCALSTGESLIAVHIASQNNFVCKNEAPSSAPKFEISNYQSGDRTIDLSTYTGTGIMPDFDDDLFLVYFEVNTTTTTDGVNDTTTSYYIKSWYNESGVNTSIYNALKDVLYNNCACNTDLTNNASAIIARYALDYMLAEEDYISAVGIWNSVIKATTTSSTCNCN